MRLLRCLLVGALAGAALAVPTAAASAAPAAPTIQPGAVSGLNLGETRFISFDNGRQNTGHRLGVDAGGTNRVSGNPTWSKTDGNAVAFAFDAGADRLTGAAPGSSLSFPGSGTLTAALGGLDATAIDALVIQVVDRSADESDTANTVRLSGLVVDGTPSAGPWRTASSP